MMKDKLQRISITIPKELADFLKKRVEGSNYASKSEFIRDLIRESLVEDKWDKEEETIGILVIIYDHHKRELSQKLIDIQHQKHINIICTTHIHIDHHNCLETIMVKGVANIILEISNAISGLNGVKFAKLVKTSILEK